MAFDTRRARELEEAAREMGPASRWRRVREGLREVRVVYTDLDGTMMGPMGNFLLNIRREYTLRPVRALVEALERGVDVVPVSGRSGRQLRETARVLGMRNYIAELGVEIVYDLGERVIVNGGPFGDACPDLYAAIMETGAPDFLLERYAGRMEYHTPWSDFRDCTPLFRGLVDVGEVNRLMDERFPGLVLVDNGVLPRTSPTLEVEEVRAYHLVPRGVTKEGAAAMDMNLRGFDRSQAIAVGDSAADLPFAREVGAFFLVRNGLYGNPDLLEEITAYDNLIVTEGFLNEGWAEAVELAVLGRTSQ
ncbi:MAG: HAD family phosphatase [Actinobacteria bacterium]|nr:HAD family phosphatase [Actinomycetota bacterium]MDI6830475.1 HAD family phosphatase [Actinomycetota bacterium]